LVSGLTWITPEPEKSFVSYASEYVTATDPVEAFADDQNTELEIAIDLSPQLPINLSPIFPIVILAPAIFIEVLLVPMPSDSVP
jgi:hypothetical protein